MNAREWSLRHAELLRRERGALADLLLSLAEFDGLAAYRELGYASLFDYLHRELRLSRGSAHYRQVATRLVARFPEVVEPIRNGRLCLTTVIVLARVMTEANRHEVLPRFFDLSRQEAEQVAVEIRPVEVVPRRTVVTEVPVPSPAVPARPAANMKEYSRSIVELAPTRTLVEPLTPRETRMHVTVSPEFVALLKKAKAGQSHVQPGATDEQVLTAALDTAHRPAGEAALQRAAPGEAGGDEAGRRKVHVAAGGRRHLRLDGAAGDRSRGPARKGRAVHDRQLQGPLPGP